MAELPPAGPVSEDELALALLLGQNRILELVTLGHPTREVLEELCRIGDRLFPGAQCALLRLDAERRRLHAEAAPGLTLDLLELLDNTPLPADNALLAAALDGRVEIADDLAAAPAWAGLAELAAALDLRAAWVLPVRGGDGSRPAAGSAPLGVLAIFHAQARRPTATGLRVLERLATLAGLAIARSRLARSAEQRTFFDALTSLPNRQLFEKLLAELVELFDAQTQRFAVVLVDLDRFQEVNRAYGFRVGDTVLRAVAQRLQRTLRKGDLLTRLDGDRFGLLLRMGGDHDDVHRLGERLQRALAWGVRFEGLELAVSCSLGLAVFPWDGADPQSLLRNAEGALATAKAKGGGHYALYAPGALPDQAAAPAIRPIEHLAPRAEEIEVRYEPRVAIVTGEVVGFTIRLFWQHPRLGRLTAGEAWAAAERARALPALTRWLARTVATQLGIWQPVAGGPLDLVLPLTELHLRDRDLETHLRLALERSGLPPERLDLVLPPESLLTEFTPAIKALHELARRGVRLTLGGFGRGLLDFAQLLALAPAALELDAALVGDCGVGHPGDALVAGLAAFAQRLGVPLAADGVLNGVQLSFLRFQGCAVAQGSVLLPPLADAAVALLLPTLPRSVQGRRVVTPGQVPKR